MSSETVAAEVATARMAFREDLLIEGSIRLGDVLDPWQREDFEALDDPAHRHAYLERPRGHSKTGDAGTEALVELFLGGPERALYAVAGDEDQASLLFKDVCAKLRRRPDLLAECKVGVDTVTHKPSGSVLTVLSSDAPTAYGLRPDWLCLDELATWRGRDLWDALWSATGKRPNARVLVISTAGWDKASLCWEVRQIADTEDDWLLSARGQCATWVDPKWLAQQQRTLPPHVFARLHLNEWVDGVGAFLTAAEVDAVFVEVLPHTRKHFVGLDLGTVKDRSVACVVGGGPEQEVVVTAIETWLPPPGGKVDLQEVEQGVVGLVRSAPAAAVIVDPWQAVHMAQRLRVEYSITTVEYPFTQSSRQKLFARLLDLVRRCKLKALPHPELRKELLGLEVRQTAGGWRADHKRGGHDDHVVALALATQRLVDFMAAREAQERGDSTDAQEAEREARIKAQTDSVKDRLRQKYGATEETERRIAEVERLYASEPDMARRHLVAWLMADTYAERLSRSRGLPGRSPLIDAFESDSDWDARGE